METAGQILCFECPPTLEPRILETEPQSAKGRAGNILWGCRQCTSPPAFCLSGCSENIAVTTKATACQCLCTGREQKALERPGQVNGAVSQLTRCRSSAELPGATHRVGSLPAASWSLTSQRHQCVKTLISTETWSPIPLGPHFLLTLFRGTLTWKMLHLCETHSGSHHQASLYWGSKESFTSCTPFSTWPLICIGLFSAASFMVISITGFSEIFSSMSSNCILRISFSIVLSVVSDVLGHLELATALGTVWGRTFLVWVLWSFELYSLVSHGLCGEKKRMKGQRKPCTTLWKYKA